MSDPCTPWYQEGLRFQCTGCGKCCTGTPGYVWISDEELDKMSQYLALSKEECIRRYTRVVGGRLALVERRITTESGTQYDCVFLKDKQCSLYDVRPKQCRTFPFWHDIVHSKQQWEATAQLCEGIHDTAPLISLEEIRSKLH